MLVHIVTAANRARYRDQLDQMHQLRHAIFIERLGWQGLSSENTREIDTFDADPDVEYLLSVNAQGEVMGSMRVLPTTGAHLFAGPLSYFIDRPYTPSARVMEGSRWFSAPSGDHPHVREARATMVCGMMEWALRRRLTHVIFAADERYVAALPALGWKLRPLGMPRAYPEGGRGIATELEVSAAALASARESWGVTRPVTYEAPPALEVDEPMSMLEFYFLDYMASPVDPADREGRIGAALAGALQGAGGASTSSSSSVDAA